MRQGGISISTRTNVHCGLDSRNLKIDRCQSHGIVVRLETRESISIEIVSWIY